MKLDLHNKLTVHNWERALHQFPVTMRKGWSRQARDQGVVVNLSKVGWIEPVAAMRIVLFVEDALSEGINVTISLPYPVATTAEQKNLDLATRSKDNHVTTKAHVIANNVRRRSAAFIALRNLRFKESLQHQHLELSSGSVAIPDYEFPREVFCRYTASMDIRCRLWLAVDTKS